MRTRRFSSPELVVANVIATAAERAYRSLPSGAFIDAVNRGLYAVQGKTLESWEDTADTWNEVMIDWQTEFEAGLLQLGTDRRTMDAVGDREDLLKALAELPDRARAFSYNDASELTPLSWDSRLPYPCPSLISDLAEEFAGAKWKAVCVAFKFVSSLRPSASPRSSEISVQTAYCAHGSAYNKLFDHLFRWRPSTAWGGHGNRLMTLLLRRACMSHVRLILFIRVSSSKANLPVGGFDVRSWHWVVLEVGTSGAEERCWEPPDAGGYHGYLGRTPTSFPRRR